MLSFFEQRVDPYPPRLPAVPPARFFPFVWACTQGMRPYIALLTLLTAGVGAFEAWLFAWLGKIVDRLSTVAPEQLWVQEGQTLLMLGAVVLASTGMICLHSALRHQTLAGNFPMRLRWDFHRHMLGQSMSFYQDEFAGRVATKVMQTALAVRDAVITVSDLLMFVLIYFLTMMFIAGGFDLWLLLPFALWLAGYIGAVAYFVPRLAKVGAAQADARSLMTGRITDAYTNIATVKLFSHTHREANFARSAMQEFMASVHAQMRLVTGLEVLNHGLNMGLVAASTGTALWLWTQQQVGIGALAAAAAMALRLNGLSHWIMWEMSSLFEHIGTVQDGVKTLSRAHTVDDVPQARTLVVKHGEIHFEEVSFAYGGGQKTVIEGLNLHIRPGEKIGLVGRSGAGKSTLVNLLLRFHDVSSGRVLIDGQDIREVTQDSLRAQIGMVTQDTSLLHRSVRDNILYGRPDADEAAMLAAARRAEAHAFVPQLTDPKGRSGYDAHVGERGVKLSGGQRQRIAIARVMLKDAPILLLDEATSALDSEVEAAIQASLDQLMDGKTVVAIAHRLSTIAAMDRLIVLDQGRVVEEGDHHSLLAQGGIYARLWARQSGGFLGHDTLLSTPSAFPLDSSDELRTSAPV